MIAQRSEGCAGIGVKAPGTTVNWLLTSNIGTELKDSGWGWSGKLNDLQAVESQQNKERDFEGQTSGHQSSTWITKL